MATAPPAPTERRHVLRLLVSAAVVALLVMPSALFDGSLLAIVVVAACAVALAVAAGVLLDRRHRSQGWASHSTRSALDAAVSAGSLHGWVEDLDLPGGSVGHVVLNPAGAFVVESSWHDLGVTERAMRLEAASAFAATARTRAVVRARGIAAGVRPVVAVWGAAQSDIPAGGVETDDVLFIRGTELSTFLRWSAAFGGEWSFSEAADCLLDLRDIPVTDRILAGAR